MINRRSFLKFSALAALAIKSKLFGVEQDNSAPIRYENKAKESFEISGFKRDTAHFINLNELCQLFCDPKQSDRYLFVEENKKLVLVKNKERIIFSPNNSFVKINDSFFQTFIPTYLYNNNLYMDIQELVTILSTYSSVKLFYDEKTMLLSSEEKGFSITGISIETKQNGLLARVYATKLFSDKYVKQSIKNENNKLYLTIYDGLMNVESINSAPLKGIIKKIQAIQLGTTCEIVFTVLGKLNPDNINLKIDEASNDILISITSELQKTDVEELDKKISTEKKQEEGSDELKKFAIDTIILDAGHGGKDPGAVGKISKSQSLYEKHVALDVALKIKTILNQTRPDIKVILTRDNDTFISLIKRGKIANQQKGKLFISLHCNASKSKSPSGFETYVLGLHKDEAAKKVALFENQVVEFEDAEDRKHLEMSGLNMILTNLVAKGNMKQSFYFAEMIDEKVGINMKSLNIKNRGVKQANFYVLYGPSMPAVLIEMAFISNKYEVGVLARKEDRSKIAQSISWAITEYKKDIDSTIM